MQCRHFPPAGPVLPATTAHLSSLSHAGWTQRLWGTQPMQLWKIKLPRVGGLRHLSPAVRALCHNAEDCQLCNAAAIITSGPTHISSL